MPKKIVFTEQQIEELRELVEQGVKQADIAKHFSVTDDTVRRLCKENGIDVKMPHRCVCIICGQEFRSNRKDAKTCNKDHYRNCVVCGAEFLVDRWNIKETCSIKCESQLKYGVDHYLQANEIKDKRKQTLQEKYGVQNVSQLDSVKEKVKQTNLEKYGVRNYMQTEEGQVKRKATNVERYGCEELLADKSFRERIAEINRDKYGTEYPMQSEEIKLKQVATMNALYNVDNAMESEEIRSKTKVSNMKKFGFEVPMQSAEIKAKVSHTCLEKYGVPWACMRKEARNYSARSKINQEFGELLKANNIEYETEFSIESYSYDFKCGNYLIEIDPTITHNSAISIFPNTSPTDPRYHLNKSQLAQEHGYQCIHVFDWDNWNRILLLIKPKKHIYARKCKVVEVDKKTAEEFTAKYHIQGSCIGQNLNVGLEYEGELMQVMTFGKPRYSRKYDLELLRLCSISTVRVIGGASKLFKHFTQLHPGKSILSYCNLSKFNGKVYEEIGMKLDHISEPAKVWSKRNEYITDNYLRQRGFDQIFHTDFGKGSSNEQLMIDHKWLPVYDCGQKVFIW